MYAKDRQRQQRHRRTLQTISELSAIENQPYESVPFVLSNRKSRSSYISEVQEENRSLRKCQSFPQFCSNPTCLQIQASAVRAATRNHESQTFQSRETAYTGSNQDNLGREGDLKIVRFQQNNVTHLKRHARGRLDQVVSDTVQSSSSDQRRLPRRPSGLPLLNFDLDHQYGLPSSQIIRGFPRVTEGSSTSSTVTVPPSKPVSRNETLKQARTGWSGQCLPYNYAFQRSQLQAFQSSIAPQSTLSSPKLSSHLRQQYDLEHFGSLIGCIPESSNVLTNVGNCSTNHWYSSSTCAKDIGIMQKQGHNGSRTTHILSDQEHLAKIQAARLATLAALTGSDCGSLEEKPTPPPLAKRKSSHHITSRSPQPRKHQPPSQPCCSRSSSGPRALPQAYTIKYNSNDTLIYYENPDKYKFFPIPTRARSRTGHMKVGSTQQPPPESEEAKVHGTWASDMQNRIKGLDLREKEKVDDTGWDEKADKSAGDKGFRRKGRDCFARMLKLFRGGEAS